MKLHFIITFILTISSFALLYSQEKHEDFIKSENLIKQGEYENAAKILEELCKEYPENYEYLSELGYSYLNSFRFDDAIETYSKAIGINKDCYKCYSHLARAYYEIEEYSIAEETIAKGFAISDTTAHLYMTRGLIYQSTNRGPQALKDFTKAIELMPNDADYYTVRLNYYLQTGATYDAYSDITMAIKINPINPEYYYYRAYILSNLSVYDEALIDIDKAISLRDNYADYYNLKFTIHMSRAEYNLAEQAVIRSLEIKPNDYYAHMSLGDLYMQINNIDRFCDCYSKAIELNSDKQSESTESMKYKYEKYCINNRMPYYLIRALGYHNAEDFGKSIAESDKGIKTVGNSATLYNIKASSHLSKREYKLASIAFDSCLILKDKLILEVKDFYSYPLSDSDAEKVAASYVVKSDFGLAVTNLIEKDYDAALIHIIKAIETAESLEGFDKIELLYTAKGLIYIGKNDLKNAEKNFDIAIDKNPYNGIPRINKAMVKVLLSAKYKPKKLAFIYEPEILCPRLIIPAMKLPKDFDFTQFDSALETCNLVIDFQPESPYAYLMKAKILQLSGDKSYCEFASQARELGLFNSFEELGADCR